MDIERIETRIRELEAWLYSNPGSSQWLAREELQRLEAKLADAEDYEDRKQQETKD